MRAVVSCLSVAVAASIAVVAYSPEQAHAAGSEPGTPARGNFAGQIDIGGGRTLYLRC